MHHCRTERTPALLTHLASIGTFAVSTCWRSPDPDEVLPAHSKVIRPLLSAASEAFVWPPATEANPLEYPEEILARERGRYRFDLSHDVLTGYMRFWNASGWRRGSIVLRLTQPPMNMVEVFMHCSGPGVFSSRYQLLKGDSRAALRYCESCASDGELAFCFSASNGIEQLSVFAPQPMLEELYRVAYDYCRPFKRWFECSPGEAVNLVSAASC